ncbi:RNase adapter RapZ [Chakrabartia godavariana]|nr:RNase adapter RapZ [Chakrabartia godavariana]
MKQGRPDRILLVTGMSGAGKSTVLNTLEDMGWEVVDNLPFQLLDRLLATQAPVGISDERPLALGIDSRTRGFDAQALVERVKAMNETRGDNLSVLFMDCAGAELERRFSETRRRHPLALDRPAADGIARERELIAPLRQWSQHVIDTTSSTTNDLKHEIRTRFSGWGNAGMSVAVLSFGFSRGLPRNADLVFDMRFLQNPYWVEGLRHLTGRDRPVSDYIRTDPAYEDAVSRIEGLLSTLLPRYRAEGKAYVTIAFGCTGGRHRSVHVAERVAAHLASEGFAPTLSHRDVGDGTEEPVARA